MIELIEIFIQWQTVFSHQNFFERDENYAQIILQESRNISEKHENLVKFYILQHIYTNDHCFKISRPYLYNLDS